MRLKILAALAKAFGIQFKFDGRPYGAFQISGSGDSA